MPKKKRFTVSNIHRGKWFNKKHYRSGLGFSHRSDAEEYARDMRRLFNRWTKIEKTTTTYYGKRVSLYLVWMKDKPKKKGQKK